MRLFGGRLTSVALLVVITLFSIRDETTCHAGHGHSHRSLIPSVAAGKVPFGRNALSALSEGELAAVAAAHGMEMAGLRRILENGGATARACCNSSQPMSAS
jgi:hypothetical protein